MSAILRGVISRTTPAVRSNVVQKATVISGPPRVRISMVEKTTVGIVMSTLICVVPAYIMANIMHYRGGDKEE